MYFGACYYPEHWPEERWERDAELMLKAGFNTLRIGEFAWTRLERYEGQFTFDWLDRCLRVFGEAGIKVILGTPTAGPPKWLMDRHPDLYKRDALGHVRGFGTRMHYCFNNDVYLSYVRRIVGAMAEHYKNNPSVVGWQIDNEFGCADTTWCYCDRCQSAFRSWLERKYGDIDALNEAWGTVVWNQTYNSFDEVPLPRLTTYDLHNPGLQLDFRRFSSDAIVRFQSVQAELLRRAAPHQPVTHNMMGPFGEIDYYKLSGELDIAGLDVYPNFPNGERINPYTPALHHDITRGLKNGSGYWILEHQSGTPGGNVMKTTPEPGELRRWTYQSIAHGADALLYFRWRTALFGGEQFWHGILQHSGVPGRKYDEVKQVGEELRKLAPLLAGSVVRNKAAIVRCYENEWVFDIQPQSPGYSYMAGVKRYHRYFQRSQAGVDIISPDADFSPYQLVILPNLMMADEAMAEKLRVYAENGGTAVLDFRAGAKSADNRMYADVLPGPFKALLGIEIDDYGIIEADGERQRQLAFAGEERTYEAEVWYDVIHRLGDDVEVIAEFTSGYINGAPAVTRRRVGAGNAYYIATAPDDAALERLLDGIVCKSDARPEWVSGHPDVESAARRKGERCILFAINHADKEIELELPAGSRDLLSGAVLDRQAALEPNGVLIFEPGKD
ncbi:beta-galactosidase [Paenibacillus sp. GCM10027626]|uniref:beta-galactosidase n=1 Tax=Paenibacillus sp. GCM10027626 TaxID=3273411 RepID=UPI00363CAEB5